MFWWLGTLSGALALILGVMMVAVDRDAIRRVAVDRQEVVTRMGWKLFSSPTPGYNGNNYTRIRTIKGWNSIEEFGPQAARGQLGTYVYANGSVYALDPDADPEVLQRVDDLLSMA